jgi:hypothetical protein
MLLPLFMLLPFSLLLLLLMPLLLKSPSQPLSRGALLVPPALAPKAENGSPLPLLPPSSPLPLVLAVGPPSRPGRGPAPLRSIGRDEGHCCGGGGEG